MQINVPEPVLQTILLSILFLLIIVVTSKKDPESHEMQHSLTNELKGIAIIMVIFCHIGYFLAKDTRFLFPLSVGGGIGVDTFLLLSGFGLAMTSFKNNLKPKDFYIKRLSTLYIPMWIVVSLFFILDLFLLNRAYSFTDILHTYLGYFPHADLFKDVDSPLWYFSLIVFYYLLFPWLFWKGKPLLSAFVILILGVIVVNLRLPILPDVQKLYKVHIVAFPLGIVFASLIKIKPLKDVKTDINKLTKAKKNILSILRIVFLITFTILAVYTSINSGVGKGNVIEQTISLVTVLSILIAFLLKNIQSDFLVMFGKYSYEIYLLHWPLIYRYDFLYKYFPAYFATMVYLVVLLVLAYYFNKITTHLFKTIHVG